MLGNSWERAFHAFVTNLGENTLHLGGGRRQRCQGWPSGTAGDMAALGQALVSQPFLKMLHDISLAAWL